MQKLAYYISLSIIIFTPSLLIKGNQQFRVKNRFQKDEGKGYSSRGSTLYESADILDYSGSDSSPSLYTKESSLPRPDNYTTPDQGIANISDLYLRLSHRKPGPPTTQNLDQTNISDLCNGTLKSYLGIENPGPSQLIIEPLVNSANIAITNKVFERPKLTTLFSGLELEVTSPTTAERFIVKVFEASDLELFQNELLTYKKLETSSLAVFTTSFPLVGCLCDKKYYYLINGPVQDYKPLTDPSVHSKIVNLRKQALKDFYLGLAYRVQFLHDIRTAHGSLTPDNVYVDRRLKSFKLVDFKNSAFEPLPESKYTTKPESSPIKQRTTQEPYTPLGNDLLALIRLFITYDNDILANEHLAAMGSDLILVFNKMSKFNNYTRRLYSDSNDPSGRLQALVKAACDSNTTAPSSYSWVSLKRLLFGKRVDRQCCAKREKLTPVMVPEAVNCNPLQALYLEFLQNYNDFTFYNIDKFIERLERVDNVYFNPTAYAVKKKLPELRDNKLERIKARIARDGRKNDFLESVKKRRDARLKNVLTQPLASTNGYIRI